MADPTPENSADTVAELLAEAAGIDGPADAPQARSIEATPSATVDPFAGLPLHTLSLLRIGVPVAVTLAAQRKSVQEIIELGPGAIIKFDKTCDEPLELCVGGQPIATGQVVKVGDKFGLRVGRLKKVAAE